ncbi:Major facilitator superfamily domain containing protein [Naviculisporaceae sp. PSN 640]
MEKEAITRPSSAPKEASPTPHSSYPEVTKESEFSSLTPANGTDDEEAARTVPGQGDNGQPTHELERWNQDKTNIFRYLSVIYAFILLGMSDGTMGALIPSLTEYYNISYTVVSLVFLSPFIGYLLAALSNNLIHHHFGQRGVAILTPTCRLAGFLPLAFHPPYPSIPVLLLLVGFGNGIEDSAWNAWIGNMHQANELLGLIHGAYGLGATIAPLICTSMIAKFHLPWYSFFYVLIALSGVELIVMTSAFWSATASVHRASLTTSSSNSSSGKQERTTTRTVMREPITWLMAFFLLGYVGAEVSLGGWIVTFMIDVRKASHFDAGLVVTFFWLGLTVGRILLGFITGRIGEKLAITIYLLLSIALELLYWLVPNFIASAIFVSFLGFFLGPLFPAAIVAATKLLPKGYHVSAIGFAAAFGGGGAAIFPFAVGAIAQKKGVAVLQPFVLAILVFIQLLWWCLPGGLKRGGLEKARESKEPVGYGVGKLWRRVVKKRENEEKTG